jgi:hypothetical protein
MHTHLQYSYTHWQHVSVARIGRQPILVYGISQRWRPSIDLSSSGLLYPNSKLLTLTYP